MRMSAVLVSLGSCAALIGSPGVAQSSGASGHRAVVEQRCFLSPDDYPTVSLRLEEQGKTIVRAEVNDQGRAARADLLVSSGFERLDEAALAVVIRRCNFKLGPPGSASSPPSAVVPIVWRLPPSDAVPTAESVVLAGQKIVRSLRESRFEDTLLHIDEYKNMTTNMPVEIHFIDAKVSAFLKRTDRAKAAIAAYFASAPANHKNFSEAEAIQATLK